MPESRDKLKKAIVIGIMSLMAIYLAVYTERQRCFTFFLPVYLVDIQWGTSAKRRLGY